MSYNFEACQTGRPVGGETILVVDDEPRLRKVLSRRLTSLGYRVFEAENGAAAMAQIAATLEITLLFTDVVMPRMTGIERIPPSAAVFWK